MSQLIGQLPAEKIAEENETCRQIVKEITNFGVNERQIMMLIYLLSLELTDHECMREIAGVIKIMRGDVFLSSIGEKDGSTQ